MKDIVQIRSVKTHSKSVVINLNRIKEYVQLELFFDFYLNSIDYKEVNNRYYLNIDI